MHLSNRAEALIKKSSSSVILQALGKAFSDQYGPANEKGVLNMGIADNSLMHDYLKTFFESNLELLPSDLNYGTTILGSTRLLSLLPSFYAKYIRPFSPLTPDQIACGNGVSALLDQLAFATCDAGEAWLTIAPYYHSFESDLKDRSQVELVAVPVSEHDCGKPAEIEALEKEMQRRSKSAMKSVKVLLLCNPQNPLGFCYSPEMLLAYARFAEKWNLMLVCDEIYALTTYASESQNAQSFTSILSVDVKTYAGCCPSRIVQLYGMSKDFGCNGFRVGLAVVQHNPSLVTSLASTAWPVKLSSASDALWSALLGSDLLPHYIDMNRTRLAEAYAFCTAWLEDCGIMFRQANSGHFVIIDLRGYLAIQNLDGEIQLLNHLVDAGVYIAPGSSFKMSTPGYFRLTFTIDRKLMILGLDRLAEALKGYKAINPRRQQLLVKYDVPVDHKICVESFALDCA